jgi:hypothetical protein
MIPYKIIKYSRGGKSLQELKDCICNRPIMPHTGQSNAESIQKVDGEGSHGTFQGTKGHLPV